MTAPNESVDEDVGQVDGNEGRRDGRSKQNAIGGENEDTDKENNDDDLHTVTQTDAPQTQTPTPPETPSQTQRQPQTGTALPILSTTRTRRLRGYVRPNDVAGLDTGLSLTSRAPRRKRSHPATHRQDVADPDTSLLPPMAPLPPIIRPPAGPPQPPPRAILAVQLKMNLEVEVILKARVCGDLLLSVL